MGTHIPRREKAHWTCAFSRTFSFLSMGSVREHTLTLLVGYALCLLLRRVGVAGLLPAKHIHVAVLGLASCDASASCAPWSVSLYS